ncbi:hypothetical protein JD844_024774 [Phrynosoma platyrhinos]|uniref:Protein unc-93 homolog A n=1 Tax=Phrynosoma platyrhinos TaxID=52577 RepID=A0ABQ7SYG1_PHRPL|nr:hypothetical protein JD844_024774 [Phrynosoma platyrhinos]
MNNFFHFFNGLVNISEVELACCGAEDCKNTTIDDTNTSKPTETLIYTLLGIYTASGILAVLLVAVFLDPVSSHQMEKEGKKKPSFWTTFLATFRHLKDRRQCLLIPLTMYSGFEQGFLAGDYTKDIEGDVEDVFIQKEESLYGVLFEKNKEAAFANYRLWESLGFVIAFGYSTFLRVSVKLYVVLAVLLVSMLLYETVEYLETKRSPGTVGLANQESVECQQNAKQSRL